MIDGGTAHDRVADDGLEELRVALDEVERVELDERAVVFEEVNGRLVDELSALG